VWVHAAGQWKAAQDVFEQMLPCGCKPDAVTYGILITAYDRAGQWCRALQVRAHPPTLSSALLPATRHPHPLCIMSAQVMFSNGAQKST
jgi:uncharacterized protein HemY